MKTLKQILAATALAAFLVGCASTDNQNSGGMGNGSQMGTGTERSTAPVAPTGANGSVGPGNPLGLGPGSGFQ